MRTRLVVLVAVAVVVVAVVVVFVVRHRSTPLEEAVASLPEPVLRVSFTDWQKAGAEVPGPDPGVHSSSGAVDAWMQKAFDKGVTAASALSTSFHALGANYGVTPMSGEWEVYGQARDGSVSLLRLKDSVDLQELENHLQEMGYDKPSDSSGVWAGSPRLVAALDEPLSPVQQNVAVVESEHLLVMSDSKAYAESAVKAINGDAATLDSASGVSSLVAAAGDPVVAEMWVKDFACEDLAMSQADPADQPQAQRLISAAGGVHPLNGLVMAQQPDATVKIGMVFASSDDASADLQPRTNLASGPAPGQGGSFSDRFKILSSESNGDTITMTVRPRGTPIIDDLGQGPVLFATC